MLRNLLKNKSFQILVATFVVVLLFAPTTLADHQQGHPAATNSVSGSAIGDSIGIVALAPVLAVLVIIQALASYLMTFAGYVLDLAWQANIQLNPAGMLVVQEGWRIMRDLANAFFILIILWIAFTIIFNFENLGGRKLLVRVVVVALLINFSLAMVSAVFGFTNIIAGIFASKIQGNDVAGIIVSATKFHTVLNSLTQADSTALAGQKNAQEKASEPSPGDGLVQEWGIKDTLLAAVGVKKADAQLLGGLAGCGIGAMLGSPLPVVGSIGGCIAGGIAGAIADAWGTKIIGGALSATLKLTFQTALSSLLLLFGAATFALAGIALLIRILVEVMLSILAPVAIALHAIPNKSVSKYWDQWLSALLRWAFFAPMFYFLFYMALFMLQTYDKAQPQSNLTTINLGADFDRILQIMVAFGFIFLAVHLSRKTGGVVAETAIDWGKKLGVVGLGFAGKMAMPAIGAAATAVGTGISQIQSPTMRRMLALPLRGVTRVAGKARDFEKKAEKDLGNMSADEIKRGLGSGMFFTPTDRMAAIRKLATDRELSADEKIMGYGANEQNRLVLEAKNNAKRMGGEWKSFVRSNPLLSEEGDYDRGDIRKAQEEMAARYGGTAEEYNGKEAAVWKTIKEMRPEHIDKNFDVSSLKDQNHNVRQAVIANWRGGHVNALDRLSPAAAKEVNDEINAEETARGLREKAQEARATGNIPLAEQQERLAEGYEAAVGRIQNIIESMDAAQYRLYNTGLMRAAGLQLPTNHRPPEAIRMENEQRILLRSLRDTIQELERAIRTRERLQGRAIGAREERDLNVAIEKITRIASDRGVRPDQINPDYLQGMKQEEVNLGERLRSGRNT
jgi:hypothetical protein